VTGDRQPPPPAWADAYLEHLARQPADAGRLVHVERLAARPPRYAPLSPPLPPALADALAACGVERLYAHQATAITRIRAGEDICVVSGTASGKSLCYNAPVLERLLAEPSATALYLFPTKALAQDQLLVLERLATASPELARRLRAGTYDGDTTPHARRKLRQQGNLILSNPDMLHQAVLPHHTRWGRFLAALATIVVDEVHSYRGIFGAHVANVMRRLVRLCEMHGSHPSFVASSATIRNPAEIASRLVGRPVAAIDEDGAPRGRRIVAFWNPLGSGPGVAVAGDGGFGDGGSGGGGSGGGGSGDGGSGDRESGGASWAEPRIERPAALDATRHLVDLVRRGVQTIVFTRSRVTAELVLRYARDELALRRGGLADRIQAYRAGYLPGERREIERRLHAGELIGVVSTNALELGIDIGGLDAAILLGFPPTIASAWQQAGRAGRQGREALVIAVAYADPIDQYLMRHPRYFFGRSPERALVDADNPHVVAGHLGCAAHEQPLADGELTRFGPLGPAVRDILVEEGRLHRVAGRTFWSEPELPSRRVNLRTISDDTYTILDAADAGRVIGTVDGISALELVYPEAIYLHEGMTYYVRELDLEQKVAFVEQRDVDYFTQPVLDDWVRVEYEGEWRWLGDAASAPAATPAATPAPESSAAARAPVIHADGSPVPVTTPAARTIVTPVAGIERPRLATGEVEVSWQTTAMRRIQFRTKDSIGHRALELPRLTLPTRATWLWVGETHWRAIVRRGRQPLEPLSGLRNLLVTVVPLHVMCDPSDLGGVIDGSNTGRPCLYLFDRYPGGLGFCERAFVLFEELLEACLELARDCPCRDGCPSCVGLPVLRPAQQQDPDAGCGWTIPDKALTIELLERLRCRDGAARPTPPTAPRRR
jgi:DEAD/DEAH box helicase domain-containing protein